MSATSPDNRVDITQEMIEKGIDFSPRDPGSYSWGAMAYRIRQRYL